MTEVFYCEQCGEEMKLQKRLSNGKTKGGTYRRRRFECSSMACDHTEVIYASGYKDGHTERFKRFESLDIEKHDTEDN